MYKQLIIITDLCDTDLYSLLVGGPEYVPIELCYKSERGEREGGRRREGGMRGEEGENERYMYSEGGRGKERRRDERI